MASWQCSQLKWYINAMASFLGSTEQHGLIALYTFPTQQEVLTSEYVQTDRRQILQTPQSHCPPPLPHVY